MLRFFNHKGSRRYTKDFKDFLCDPLSPLWLKVLKLSDACHPVEIFLAEFFTLDSQKRGADFSAKGGMMLFRD